MFLPGLANLIAILQRAEGYGHVIYLDGLGNPTGGWGHLCRGMAVGTPVSIEQATQWLRDDISRDTGYTVHLPEYEAVCDNECRTNALIECVFNLGVEHWTELFPKTREALKAKQWQAAHDHLMDSPLWIAQVGKSRVERIANSFLTGVYPTYPGSTSSRLAAALSAQLPSGTNS